MELWLLNRNPSKINSNKETTTLTLNPSLNFSTTRADSSVSSQSGPQLKLAVLPGHSLYLGKAQGRTVCGAECLLLLLKTTQWAFHQCDPSIVSWSLETLLDSLRQERMRPAIHNHNTTLMQCAGAVPSLCAFCCLRERAKMGVPVKRETKQNGWLFWSNKNGFVGSKREKKI